VDASSKPAARGHRAQACSGSFGPERHPRRLAAISTYLELVSLELFNPSLGSGGPGRHNAPRDNRRTQCSFHVTHRRPGPRGDQARENRREIVKGAVARSGDPPRQWSRWSHDRRRQHRACRTACPFANSAYGTIPTGAPLSPLSARSLLAAMPRFDVLQRKPVMDSNDREASDTDAATPGSAPGVVWRPATGRRRAICDQQSSFARKAASKLQAAPDCTELTMPGRSAEPIPGLRPAA